MKNLRIFLAFLASLLLVGGVLGLTTTGAAKASTYSCTTSSSTGSCGPYTNPSVNLGTNETDNVVQDEWNAGSTEGTVNSQVLQANSSSDWQATANMTGNGAVLTSPEDQVTPENWTGSNNLPVPLADYSSIKSTYDTTLPATPGPNDDYEAMYDIWLGDSTKSQWTGDQEIMVWTDNHNQTPAGTDTGKTWTDPSTGDSYEIWVDNGGSPTTLGSDDIVSFEAKTNHASGSVDLYALFNFLKSGGYSTGSIGVDQVTFGFELCSTSGQDETFKVNNYTLTSTGDGQNGAPGGGGGGTTGQAPAASTDAASNVTSSGATLNGSVNPEGAATTYQFDYGTDTSYGTSVPVPAGDAGSGTSAVNESAALSGLQPSTTYHYRLEATNATGTSYGPDQSFTTASSGGGTGSTVYVDSSVGAKAANTGDLSWTHTVGTGSDRALLVEATVGVSSDVNCSQTVTMDGTPLNKLAVIHTNGQNAGYMDIWGMANPPSGAHTMDFKVSGCNGGTPSELTAGSMSFTGADQANPFSAVTTAVGASANPTVTLGSDTGNKVVGFVADGSAISGIEKPGFTRFIENQDNGSGAGNSAAATTKTTGSPVTMTWDGSNDWWAVGALQVQHS